MPSRARFAAALLVLALAPAVPAAAGTATPERAVTTAQVAKAKQQTNRVQAKRAATKRRANRRQATPTAEIPVTFTVRNTNTSDVPCAADGATYDVKGTIVGPRSKLTGTARKSAALYVHGLGYGEFFWRFKDVPGYDYAAEQAKAGHVSVTIDRLGYGASGKPDGNLVCYGSEADYLNQITGQLKSGDYRAEGSSPVRFDRLALAGHSAGGFMVEGKAISYGVDALMVFGFANGGAGPETLVTFAGTQIRCLTDPLPNNYAPFGATEADFRRQHLFNVEPAVADAVVARRAPDPCGDTLSAPQSILVDIVNASFVSAPVLIVNGANDALFMAPQAGLSERLIFAANRDATQVTLPETGHALTLGRTAPQFRKTVSDWLTQRGF